MGEPPQLSAFPAALVLALYTAIAGTTTGALLFVRAVVLVCKAAMSAVFFRDFKQTLGRHGALLSAVVLFVYTPKWFLGPDYISQQFHFTVAAFLCFYHYYTHGFRRPWLVVLGAVCACFSFLAFPQSALAAAVILQQYLDTCRNQQQQEAAKMEEQDNIIELIDDETGAPIRFQHLATIEHEGELYIALSEADAPEDGQCEVFIMQVAQEEDGTESYIQVEDEAVQQAVFDKFLQLVNEGSGDDE